MLAKLTIIPDIAKIRENNPKSSGLYNLVIIGINKIPNIWAIVVPPINFK